MKGTVVYYGRCSFTEHIVNTIEEIPLNGVYILKDLNQKRSQKVRVKNNKIYVLKSSKSDSLLATENSNLRTAFASKVLKKEGFLLDDYYFRTNFFAINGIGYDSRNRANDNFKSLFSYIENDVSNRFPEDTISTGLIFNKTSGSLLKDGIQTLLLKREELIIKIKQMMDENAVFPKLGYWLKLPSQYIMDELLPWVIGEENERMIKEMIEEFVEARNQYLMELQLKLPIVGENIVTESSIKNALIASANNKSRAIVLGHSQGGLYTYKVFNTFSDSISEHFYSLNVAVPTDLNPNWYFINEKDFVVNTMRYVFPTIPPGETNHRDDGKDFGGESGHYHAWKESYYDPHLLSYGKINGAIEYAFETVPYWKKEWKNARYQLVWYNGAAQTTVEIAKADGSFVTLGTYHGYDVTDPTIKTIPNILLQDGVPVLRVKSYHRNSWWGPYLSTDPGFFKIISNDDGSLTYLMSDAWSRYSFDDAEFRITLMVE